MRFYYPLLIASTLAFMTFASPIANADANPIANANAMPANHELSSRAVEVEAVKLKAREDQYALYCCDQQYFQGNCEYVWCNIGSCCWFNTHIPKYALYSAIAVGVPGLYIYQDSLCTEDWGRRWVDNTVGWSELTGEPIYRSMNMDG